MPERFNAAAALLPPRLRAAAMALPAAQRGVCEDIRLRLGRAPTLRTPEGERPFAPDPVTAADLADTMESASGCSLHACLDQLRQGFLCAPGGVRLGVCGAAILEDGVLSGLRGVSSLSLRVARPIPGAGREILPQLRGKSVLVLSPPGGGKTTFLRELVRTESDAGLRVGLADERGELSGLTAAGLPGFDVGRCTDVLSGVPKAAAALMLLRSMGPEAVAMDELSDRADAAAVTALLGCGVRIFASAHAADRFELTRRPLFRDLLACRAFDALVRIRGRGAHRRYEVESV